MGSCCRASAANPAIKIRMISHFLVNKHSHCLGLYVPIAHISERLSRNKRKIRVQPELLLAYHIVKPLSTDFGGCTRNVRLKISLFWENQHTIFLMKIK